MAFAWSSVSALSRRTSFAQSAPLYCATSAIRVKLDATDLTELELATLATLLFALELELRRIALLLEEALAITFTLDAEDDSAELAFELDTEELAFILNADELALELTIELTTELATELAEELAEELDTGAV